MFNVHKGYFELINSFGSLILAYNRLFVGMMYARKSMLYYGMEFATIEYQGSQWTKQCLLFTSRKIFSNTTSLKKFQKITLKGDDIISIIKIRSYL